jgi:hypothetical protein
VTIRHDHSCDHTPGPGQVWRDEAGHSWFLCGIARMEGTGERLVVQRRTDGRDWIAAPIGSLGERNGEGRRRWQRIR